MMSVETSPVDDRSYKLITLPNELQCLLVSDTAVSKSAMALSVAVGAACDPTDRPGLAHFLQHMLFMGTKTFPQQDAFSKLIKNHSGYSNAFTNYDQTNFFFKLQNEAFATAIEMFACFFKEPIFAPEAVEKELKVLDSQHRANLSNPLWSRDRLLQLLSRPDCSFRKFLTGSQQTLTGPNLRDNVELFYKANYSANLMKLAVCGPFPLADLQAAATSLFSTIPNRSIDRFREKQATFPVQSLGKLVRFKPAGREQESIEFVIILPYQLQEAGGTDAVRYYANLVSRVDQGSFFSQLKQEGLATQVTAGCKHYYSAHFTQFNATVKLTEKGAELPDLVARRFWSYLQFLKGANKKQMFQEAAKVSQLRFNNKQKERTQSLCSSAASNLQNYPAHKALSACWLMGQFAETDLFKLSALLVPENAFIIVESGSFQSTRKQQIYQFNYQVEELPADFKLAESISYGLPKPNPYLRLLASQPSRLPTLTYNSQRTQLYHLIDPTAKADKGYFCISVLGPTMHPLAELIINSQLKQQLSEGSRAMISSSCSLDSKGITLEFMGLCPVLPSFAVDTMAVLHKILESQRIPNFKQCVSLQASKQKQRLQKQPYQLVLQHLARMLAKKEEQPMTEAKQEEIVKQLSSFAKNVCFRALAVGRFSAEAAEVTARRIQDLFKGSTVFRPIKQLPAEAIQNSKTANFKLGSDHNNSAVLLCWQLGPDSPQNQITAALVRAALQPMFVGHFKSQKGNYYSGVSELLVAGSVHVCFRVMGEASAQTLSRELRQWRQKIEVWIDGYDDFKNLKSSVRGLIDEWEFDIARTGCRYFREIESGRLLFTRKQDQLRALDELSQQRFKASLKELLSGSREWIVLAQKQ